MDDNVPAWTRTTHRWATWVNAWTVVGLPGLCVAVLVWGAAGTLGASVLLAGFCVAGTAMAERSARGEAPNDRLHRGWAARVVTCAVVLGVSVPVWLPVSAATVVLVALVAGATTPTSVDLFRACRGVGRRSAPRAVPTASPAMAATMSSSSPARESADRLATRLLSQRLEQAAQAMSDAQLCCAWRRSYWTLRETTHPVQRLAIVLQRESLLNAFDTRDAIAFEEWLTSTSRASATFEPVFGPHGSGHAARDDA